MIIFRYSAIFLLLAGCGGINALPAAQKIGRDYCAAVVAKDEAAALALMSPNLQMRVAKLRAIDAAFRAAHPGEKPPLGDGLRLTAFPDAVQACKADAVIPTSTTLTYAPTGDPKAVWHDRLLLVQGRDGRLVIDDIAYAPDEKQLFSGWLESAGQ